MEEGNKRGRGTLTAKVALLGFFLVDAFSQDGGVFVLVRAIFRQ